MPVSINEQLTSRLGFGTWQFGGPNIVNGNPTGWGQVDKTEAIRAVHAALDEGINFFDTADSYGRGQAETILREAFAQKSATNTLICTKFGNRQTPAGQPVQDYSAAYLTEAVEASLSRLGVDTLDIMLLHSPPDAFDWSTYDPKPFDDLVQAGKIRSYGVSSRSIYGARRVMEAGFGNALEVIYNALDSRAEGLLFTEPNANDYFFIGRVPLASGFLNPAYLTQDPVFSTDEYRHYLPERDRNWLLESMRKLAFLNEEPGGMVISALRFSLSNDAIGVVIPGMRNERQVAANRQAEELGPLAPDFLARIRQAVPDVAEHWKPKA
ncbi:aldo/keto reductase [Spirosoma fluviale]|uniref:Predicted oxidoreductase n=1 Tax=Spirosoma fluviale TaxID=1597977 RepID=A0A286FY92_9BACT|nr:aldo/keto reductase [Spirosoma fluviale]SOD87986.1 Predicted oxidoreductase [Spirosoma fluviale]